jgi:hypothetical protein
MCATGYRRNSAGSMCYYLREPAAGSDSSVPPLVFVHGVGKLLPTNITRTHYMFVLALRYSVAT